MILGAARGARLPQLHRQALLHPVGIDDAGLLTGRPAGGHQISLRLVLRVADHPQSGWRSSARWSCRPVEPWGITLPFMKGRVLGRLPERGDIVIVTPPGRNEDYIKRVIGLPGDTLADDRRHVDHQRQAGEARRRARRRSSRSTQLAVRDDRRLRAAPLPRSGPDRATDLPGADRPRNPAQRPLATTRSSWARPARTISRRPPSPPATSG